MCSIVCSIVNNNCRGENIPSGYFFFQLSPIKRVCYRFWLTSHKFNFFCRHLFPTQLYHIFMEKGGRIKRLPTPLGAESLRRFNCFVSSKSSYFTIDQDFCHKYFVNSLRRGIPQPAATKLIAFFDRLLQNPVHSILMLIEPFGSSFMNRKRMLPL